MKRIAIVGGGQSGLQLAFGLLGNGYDVTVYTDRDADEVGSGPVMSAQCMFESSLQLERDLSLDLWHEEAPEIASISMTRTDATGALLTSWTARLDNPARSVDQRLKISTWMRHFVAAGGSLVVGRVDLEELDRIAVDVDLVVVATGLSELGSLFPIDEERTRFDRPQRALALTYYEGAQEADQAGKRYFHIRGVGEYYSLPALTAKGSCEIMMIEAVPGGPLDRWGEVASGAEHLARCKEFLEEYLPEEAARCRDIRLTDDGGYLTGRFTPVVRHPIGTLPSGRLVLGMADAVVLNDPVTAQGANNAAKSADIYLQSIMARGDDPFDEDWMQETFERYWQGYGEWAVAWTNSMLEFEGSPGEQLVEAAATSPALAKFIVNGYNDPRNLYPAWFDAAESRLLIERSIREDNASQFDTRALRRALGQFATGVVVVTTRGEDGERIGLTVNSFTSVSMDPPLVLWCLSSESRNLEAFRRAEQFNIHVLASDQHHLSRRFSSPHAEKFEGMTDPDSTITPVLEGAAAQFLCNNVRQYTEGDHEIFIGEVREFTQFEQEPLVFHSGTYRVATRHPDFAI